MGNLLKRGNNSYMKLTTDPTHICNLLNYHCITLGKPCQTLYNRTSTTQTPKSKPDLPQPPKVDSLSNFSKLTQKELGQIFNSLPPKNSSGLDQITNKMIKYCKSEIIMPLLHIINTSKEQYFITLALKEGINFS